MFKFIIFTLFLSLALFVSCTADNELISINGSGKVVIQEETITEFDKVNVSDVFKVNIRQGDAFQVVIRIDDNLIQYLEVVKEEKTLKIGLDDSHNYDVKKDYTTLQADVVMPELIGLDLSLASECTLTAFKSTKELDVKMSVTSTLRGDIEAGDVRFDVSWGSEVVLSGSARDVAIDASESSWVNLIDFPVVNAEVNASNASKVTINPSGTLDVRARDRSRVYYLGSPTLGKIDTDGSSSVKHK